MSEAVQGEPLPVAADEFAEFAAVPDRNVPRNEPPHVKGLDSRVARSRAASPAGPLTRADEDRNGEMAKMRAEGWTLAEIGAHFDLSRERVRQILKQAGGPTMAESRAALRASRLKREEEVTSRIRQLVSAVGPRSVNAVASELGLAESEVSACWPEDREAMRIRVRGQEPKWSDAQVLHCLQIAGTYEFPLRTSAYDELIRVGEVEGPSSIRIAQRFGSWTRACLLAGIEPAAARRSSYNSAWTDDDLVGFVAEFLAEPGSRGTFEAFDRWLRSRDDAPSAMTVRNRLGSWSEIKATIARPR